MMMIPIVVVILVALVAFGLYRHHNSGRRQRGESADSERKDRSPQAGESKGRPWR
jgi:hypothetical protein